MPTWSFTDLELVFTDSSAWGRETLASWISVKNICLLRGVPISQRRLPMLSLCSASVSSAWIEFPDMSSLSSKRIYFIIENLESGDAFFSLCSTNNCWWNTPGFQWWCSSSRSNTSFESATTVHKRRENETRKNVFNPLRWNVMPLKRKLLS